MASMPESPWPPVRRREIFGWAMFDFANSSYTTLIITVAFAVYFKSFVAGERWGDLLWSSGIFVTNLLVMLASPLIGAIADGAGRKKLFLFSTYSLCVLGTASLYFVTPGAVVLALVLVVISNLAFSFGENFTSAFLPEISTPQNIGRISAIGWGVGYFGGLACLVLVKPYLGGLDLTVKELLSPEHEIAFRQLRFTWPLVAGFFLAAGLPTFLFLKERAPRPRGKGIRDYAREGFGRLRNTFSDLSKFSQLRRFLVAFFFFQAGLTAIIAFAAIFASTTLGFSAGELITLFILLQLSAAGGALAFGWLQDRIGGNRSLQITLILWLVVCVLTYFCRSKELFWGIALFAGLGMGSLQSAARAVVGSFSPTSKSGEFFGFWGLAGKAAYAVGPSFFGLASSLTGSQRVGILTTGALFLVGLLLLRRVDEAQGRREAETWESAAGHA